MKRAQLVLNQSEDKLLTTGKGSKGRKERSSPPLPRYKTLPRASAGVVKKVCQHLRLLGSLGELPLPNSQFSLEKRVTRHLNAAKPGSRQGPQERTGKVGTTISMTHAGAPS